MTNIVYYSYPYWSNDVNTSTIVTEIGKIIITVTSSYSNTTRQNEIIISAQNLPILS